MKHLSFKFVLAMLISITTTAKAQSDLLSDSHDIMDLDTTRIPFGSWQNINNLPPFGPGVVAPLLLTDGSVLVQDGTNWGNMWRLIPDNKGSYVNGTWTQVASLPDGYGPLFFASAVLADGRVIFMGGEFNNGVEAFTSLGAIYDPVADVWSIVPPPAFFSPSGIGDAASVILNDGTFMLQAPLSRQAALLNLPTLTWTETGTLTKVTRNDEEGWTLLPNGKVLTVDTYTSGPYPSDPTASEIYNPNNGQWSSAGSTINTLTDPVTFEVGPAVLRPNGTVFALGSTGNTSIYNAATNSWAVGPTLTSTPAQQGCPDAPGALLPNGNVLFAACTFDGSANGAPPTRFFEFNGTGLTEEPAVADAADFFASQFNMLVLPTGQILMSCIDTNNVEFYTPANKTFDPNWAPVIFSAPKKVGKGKTYKIKGIRFNGMSQGAMFGDDYQSATNYPLVRITNNKTKHVFYCRTHDHSFMGVASNQEVFTYFDVPDDIEKGKSKLEVVANGIPSRPICIKVKSSCKGDTIQYTEDYDFDAEELEA